MTVQAIDRSAASMRERVSPAEWETRVKLAACYRLMAHAGVADLTYNHLSARVPDRPDRYLIKGERTLFDEITASALLTYDLDGNKIYESADKVGIGGLVIHGGVMEARPDIMAVFHTHTPANMGVSSQKFGLLQLTQHSSYFYNQIGYHDFGGFEFDIAGRQRLVADLAGSRTLLLRNHGALVCGRSIPEAYVMHHFLEMACQAQVAALSAGGGIEHINVISPAKAEHAGNQVAKMGERNEQHRDWDALMRLADRLDPSFRD
jgi:ribulose-5-phosphate 4-epimerase/fuculose-1-phosphate aldolase